MAVYGSGTYGAGLFGIGQAGGGEVTDTPVTGQQYQITYYPRLSNGTPVDVTSVDRIDLYDSPARTGTPTVTILGPAAHPAFGTYVLPAAVMPAAGVYHAVVTFTAAGVQQQDSNDTLTVYAFDGGFTAAGIVTLAEVKRHLNIPDSTTRHDLELQLHAATALDVLENRVGPIFPRTVIQTARSGWGATTVVLDHAPVLDVVSVQRAGAALTWTLSPGAGLLHGADLSGATITYTAGRDPIPAALKLAALMLIEAWWSSQRGASPSPLAAPVDPADLGGSAFLSRRIEDLLRPYLLPSAVA